MANRCPAEVRDGALLVCLRAPEKPKTARAYVARAYGSVVGLKEDGTCNTSRPGVEGGHLLVGTAGIFKGVYPKLCKESRAGLAGRGPAGQQKL